MGLSTGGGAANEWSYAGFARAGVSKVGHVAKIAAAFRAHVGARETERESETETDSTISSCKNHLM